MAVENVGKFEELLRADENLQAKLKAAAEAYGGSKDDRRVFFDAVIVPLAAEAGMPFSYDEAGKYHAADRELNDAELEAVAGGDVGCIVVGLSDDVDAEFEEGQVFACVWLGVSFAL